jgi:hypothetical protein
MNSTLRVDQDIAYQQTGWGWLPSRWTNTTRNPPNRIINVTKLKVQDYSVDPPADAKDYQIDITPGMNVRESTLNESGAGPPCHHHEFHVGPDGHWNKVVNGVEQRSVGSWRHWLGVLLTGSVVLMSAFLFYWRASRRKAARLPNVS